MGVQVRLVVYAPDAETGKSACKAAFDRVADLEDVMSDYRPTSELMRLCAKSGQGPVHVSDDLFRVLAFGQEVAKRSNGAFDMTVGPVVALWRTARKTRLLPPTADLQIALSKVGYKKITLDPAAKTVSLAVPNMKLDLGGIAKGDAGDQALKILAAHGITSALFQAGGDIVVSNAPPDQTGWDIELPPGEASAPKKLTVKIAAVSTSGDEVQFVIINGQRYSHIVNPHTGLGLTEHNVATILAPQGIASDALSKVATVLPPDQAKPIVESFRAQCWIGKSPTTTKPTD